MIDIPDPKYDRESLSHRTHYYGDYVRRLYIIAGLIQLVALPYLESYISLPLFISTFAILVIVIFAGFTNPKQKWVAFLNLLTSLVGLVVFEYFSVTTYSTSGVATIFFWANQVLALIFFFALYYSSKTLRGMYLE